ncbi:MAG: T9SS type A sorting domain-containing protein [Bacteroidales bacterium]|nr:T9SS type A sorting domain-containing protein [Bacteroidales bacterium]
MKRSLLILLALLLVGSGFAQKAPTTKLISSSENRIVVNFQLNGYSTIRVQTPRGEQFVVTAPDMATTLDAGAPELPMFPIPAIIGDLAEMTVNVIDAQYTDVNNIDIAPSKGNISRQVNPADVPFTYGAMYDENAFYPAAQATLEAPYILRDFRGQNIMVHPFAFNPQTHTLRVYENLTIEMVKVSDNGENPKAARKSNTIKVSPEQKGAYAHRFINFTEATKAYPFVTDNGEMLIICADPYMAGMEELVTWKNISGRPTTMVSVTEAGGNNDTQIKNYINSYYTNPQHNLAFVLLVGDYADLTPHVLGQERSDNWFGQLEGTDHYPEVFIGRFSVQTDEQVATHVNKVIGYERDVEADITWGDKGLGIGYIGAGSGHYGEDDYQHIDLIRDTLLHYTYNTVTELHGGGGGASTTSISNTINQGVGIINYCNHGSETSWGVANYSTSNVHALTNDNMLPIVWSVACLNGKFNYGSECFAEAWMRATDNSTGAPTGAVGGMFSWMSQPWVPPMYGQDEMVDILTEWRSVDQFYHTLGGASLNGNMSVIDKSGSSGYDTHDTWILFGDPSMMVRTANPTEMDVTVTPAAPMIGTGTLSISTDATCGVATLSKDGEVLASGQLVDGDVELNFTPFDNVGTYDLIIMGYNKVTYRGTLEVLPAEGAYVSVDAFTPGNVPTSEEQLMSITFRNVGVDATTGTTNVVLSSEDTNITFNDNEGSFGVLAPDATITLEDEFSFTVAPGVPDGTKIQIDVTATCGSNVWTGKAKITVGAPIVVFDSFLGGGGFTPGEALNVIANFRNDGHYMATNAIVTVSTTSPYVTFTDDTFEIGTIDSESTSAAVFNFTIAETCPTTEVINLEFTLVADNEVMATGSGNLKNTCNVVFNLVDSYGDGWNGNQLTVSFSDGTPSQNLTISSGSSATYTLEIGIGVHVTLGWITGSYTSECSFTVAYEGGDQITSASNLSGGYSFEFDVNCGGEPIVISIDPVTDLAGEVDVVNQNVTLTWVAPEYAKSYIVKRNGEVVINGLVGTTYIDEDPLAQATYCVIAEYPGGDESVEECVEVLYPLGVEESESNFHIYPNPVNSTLYIQSGDEFSYFMFNGMGQQVANGNAKGTATINVSNMTKGVYFLRITTGNGISTKKVVVE